MVAKQLKRQDASIAEYEAAAASFTRALELGGDAVLLRKMQFGAMHNAGGSLRTRGKAGGNTEDIKRGEALSRQAYEGRSGMVEQQPGYSEYWRDLAFSHDTLGSIALDEKNAAAELHYRQESLRCREKAVRHQPASPRLIFDRASSCWLLAECLLRRIPPDTSQAVELKLRGFGDWRQGVEMTGFRQVLSGYLHPHYDIRKLVKLAVQSGGSPAVETLSRARAIIEPLIGRMQDDGKVAAAFAELLIAQAEMLTLLGRSAEAAEVRTAVEKLTVGKSAAPGGLSR